MTKPALVPRMDEAEGHFVYVKLNELDLFERLRGQTGKQHFQLMCLARIGRRGPRNLLELLPDEFTLDDARRVRQQQGISNEGYSAIRMIRTWVNRGYVIQNTEYSFLKSEKYKGKS